MMWEMWEILGIEPTDDIKAIKSAYAKLARQYNPEEHPDEFRRVFDAYKSACDYAKMRRRSSSPKNDTVTEKPAPEKESGLSFGSVDTNKKPPSDEQEKVEKLSFDGVNPNKKYPSEEKEKGKELSFESVNLNKKRKFKLKDKSDSFKFNLNNAPKGHSEEAYPDDNGSGFDFSGVNKDYDDEAEEKIRQEKRRVLVRTMRMLLKNSAGYKQWKDFFDDKEFAEQVYDIEFRIAASKLFAGERLDKCTAQLIAEKFGMGSGIVYLDYKYDIWSVRITKGTQPYKTEKKKVSTIDFIRKNAAAFFVCIAVMLITLLPAMIDPDNVRTENAETSYTNELFEYIDSEEDVNRLLENKKFDYYINESYTTEELYEFCKGRWEFDFGYIELKDNYAFEMDSDGDIVTGTVKCQAMETGARLTIEFSVPDTVYDGTTAHAGIFFNDMKLMTYTDWGGMIYTGRVSEGE